MRHAYNSALITDDETKKLVGIYMGSDFVSEHEWGIKEMKNMLHIDPSLPGLESKMVGGVDPDCVLVLPKIQGYGKEYSLLLFSSRFEIDLVKKAYAGDDPFYDICSYLSLNPADLKGEEGISTAWDDSSFAILANEAMTPHLKDFYERMQEKDVFLVMTNISGPFANPCPTFFIRSRTPDDLIKQIS